MPEGTTVHNPGNADHYMRVKPVAASVTVTAGDTVLADSQNALRVIEVGKDIYDPVIYVPKSDTSAALIGMGDKSTHCPLKGDAHYFSLDGSDEPIAWIYDRPLPFATVIGDHVAFYTHRVAITETGAAAA